jgi:predicted PurR-regulated permease PerM
MANGGNGRSGDFPGARAVAKTVITAVAVLIALYLVYRLRKPISWLAIALFLAVALSGPVNFLERHMKRGFAIGIIYLALFLVPVGIAAIVVPPIVNGAEDLAKNAPQYATDVTNYVNDNKRLKELNQKYDVTQKLQDEAAKLPSKVGDAAGLLRDVGFGLINSIFALVTILILTAFMLGGGRGWIDAFLRYLPPEQERRMSRVLDRSARAVGNYVAGALAQATLAGVTAYIVLQILNVPFAAPLSLLIFFLDLIPLVGATIGAVIVGIVTLFADFPTVTIIWVIFAIIYQQVENSLVQPQIQRRAVAINPFLVVVSVLFGSALLGVLGALVAVPVAATIQIVIREWADYVGIQPRDSDGDDPPPTAPPEGPIEGLGGPGPEPHPA